MIRLVTRPDFVSNCKKYLFQIAKYMCIKLTNVYFSNWEKYLSRIAICIGLKLWNVFVSNCKMYLWYIHKCICVILTNVFVYWIFLKLQNEFVHGKMYLSQVAKFVCLKLQISFVLNYRVIYFTGTPGPRPRPDFVSNCKKYLFQIAKYMCLKFTNVYFSNWEMYLSRIAICICDIFTNVSVLYWPMYLCTLNFSQTAKWICSKWPNVFVSSSKFVLSKIAN